MAGVRAVAVATSVNALPLRELIDECTVALEVAGRSQRTIGWYRTYLDDFVKFASREDGSATLDDIAPAIARRWLLATQSTREPPLAPNSVAGRVRTLRAFAGWLQHELQLGSHPLAGLV
jgi:site-specific recombinase XerC